MKKKVKCKKHLNMKLKMDQFFFLLHLPFFVLMVFGYYTSYFPHLITVHFIGISIQITCFVLKKKTSIFGLIYKKITILRTICVIYVQRNCTGYVYDIVRFFYNLSLVVIMDSISYCSTGSYIV